MPIQTLPLVPLRVLRAAPVADAIHAFTLGHDDGSALPAFTAGAHLHVRAPNGMVRRYSLCNDPGETDSYTVAVKREANGTGGSRSLVDDTSEGDLLHVSEPRNDFALQPAPSYILIAGGIGITPLLSMARHLISRSGPPFRLFYLGRSPGAMAFADVMTSPGFRGRVVMHCDDGDPERSFDLWPVLERSKGAHLYCCGPRGLMQSVRDMTGHWSQASVHFEDFGGAGTAQPDDTAFRIRLARTGATLAVPVGRTILDVLRGHGLVLASSCESGSCGTCQVRLLEGEADHRDLVLSEHERARHIMVCVSRAKSDELVLDL